MLDGWYCRSIADEAAAAEEEEEAVEESKCKKQYKFLKTKLKSLIYENECFHEALKAAQKRLLVVSRDRTFLLNRLLQLESFDTSSESEDTESSEDETIAPELVKRRKIETVIATNPNISNSGKKKKVPQGRLIPRQHHASNSFFQSGTLAGGSAFLSDGHMTPEEVERHLQSRQTYVELMPERAPLTVPTEMFSNEPSLDSESNDVGELETSPSNLGDELSIEMINE